MSERQRTQVTERIDPQTGRVQARTIRLGNWEVPRRSLGGWILLALALLLLLAFILSPFLNPWNRPANSADELPPSDLLLQSESSILGASDKVSGSGATSGGGVALNAQISPLFAGAYATYGGLTRLGLPISEPLLVNGRQVQWFERGRLEYWPEHAGTAYEFQLGLVGSEYTEGRDFPQQSYFVSRPGLRFFPETGHAVGGLFLTRYDQGGGLVNFGFPISDEFDEVLADGRSYRVQYFERARMEYHPELVGTGNEIQIGLLGRALYLNERWPGTIPPAPTAIPLQ